MGVEISAPRMAVRVPNRRRRLHPNLVYQLWVGADRARINIFSLQIKATGYNRPQ
jgi:hypothetical protein